MAALEHIPTDASTKITETLAGQSCAFEEGEERSHRFHQCLTRHLLLEQPIHPTPIRASAEVYAIAVGNIADESHIGNIGTGTAEGTAIHANRQAFIL